MMMANDPAPPAGGANGGEVRDLPADFVQLSAEIARRRESARAKLAYILTLILAGTIAFAAYAITTGPPGTGPDIQEFLQLVLPAEIALLGSAVGFYFGAQRR
jgi:hypothetical protein